MAPDLVHMTKSPIVPRPVEAEFSGRLAEIHIPIRTLFVGIPINLQVYFAELMEMTYGWSIANNTESNEIVDVKLEIDIALDVPDEGYQLCIVDNGRLTQQEASCIASITSKDPAGLFYGIQSFRQLIPQSDEDMASILQLPHCTIKDYPSFSWRGYMLDVARYFYGVNTLKKLIDGMALLKMNRLHLHLTDDQGWRLHVDKLPKLTQIGSKRAKSNIRGRLINKTDGIPHEGFFNSEEIQEIISYAKAHYITVIPEIDLPGHIRAALASYPKLACKNVSQVVPALFKIYKDVLCIGNEESLEFAKSVLDQVIEEFESDIVHIGGDETPTDRWKQCSKCQAKLDDLDSDDERQLQHYFTNEIMEYLNKKGKITMGWNEIIKSGSHTDAIVQHWLRDVDSVNSHLENGGKAVMSNFFHVYFNYDYVVIPMRKTYSYDPIPDGLSKDAENNILGIEGAIWTQWIKNERNLFCYTFPRLAALAEVGWTQDSQKDYADFKKRLEKSFLDHLKYLQIPFMPLQKVDPSLFRRIFMPIHILLGAKTLKDEEIRTDFL